MRNLCREYSRRRKYDWMHISKILFCFLWEDTLEMNGKWNQETDGVVTAGCHCRHQKFLVSWAEQCIGRFQMHFEVESTGHTDDWLQWILSRLPIFCRGDWRNKCFFDKDQ